MSFSFIDQLISLSRTTGISGRNNCVKILPYIFGGEKNQNIFNVFKTALHPSL